MARLFLKLRQRKSRCTCRDITRRKIGRNKRRKQRCKKQAKERQTPDCIGGFLIRAEKESKKRDGLKPVPTQTGHETPKRELRVTRGSRNHRRRLRRLKRQGCLLHQRQL